MYEPGPPLPFRDQSTYSKCYYMPLQHQGPMAGLLRRRSHHEEWPTCHACNRPPLYAVSPLCAAFLPAIPPHRPDRLRVVQLCPARCGMWCATPPPRPLAGLTHGIAHPYHVQYNSAHVLGFSSEAGIWRIRARLKPRSPFILWGILVQLCPVVCAVAIRCRRITGGASYLLATICFLLSPRLSLEHASFTMATTALPCCPRPARWANSLFQRQRPTAAAAVPESTFLMCLPQVLTVSTRGSLV